VVLIAVGLFALWRTRRVVFQVTKK